MLAKKKKGFFFSRFPKMFKYDLDNCAIRLMILAKINSRWFDPAPVYQASSFIMVSMHCGANSHSTYTGTLTNQTQFHSKFSMFSAKLGSSAHFNISVLAMFHLELSERRIILLHYCIMFIDT